MSDELTDEVCCECHSNTGRAGRADDSLYLGDYGPYCWTCFNDFIDSAVQKEVTSLRTQLAESEKKREAAESEHRKGDLAYIGLLQRAEAAEANYVALREKIQQCKGFHHYNNEEDAIVNRSDWLTLMEIFEDPHPGTDLLARMKRMEPWVKKARDEIRLAVRRLEIDGGMTPKEQATTATKLAELLKEE